MHLSCGDWRPITFERGIGRSIQLALTLGKKLRGTISIEWSELLEILIDPRDPEEKLEVSGDPAAYDCCCLSHIVG